MKMMSNVTKWSVFQNPVLLFDHMTLATDVAVGTSGCFISTQTIMGSLPSVVCCCQTYSSAVFMTPSWNAIHTLVLTY